MFVGCQSGFTCETFIFFHYIYIYFFFNVLANTLVQETVKSQEVERQTSSSSGLHFLVDNLEYYYSTTLRWNTAGICAHLGSFGHSSGHDQLDHPSFVALCWHGLAQRLHGVLVGFAQQRLSIDSDQLVVDPQPSILSESAGIFIRHGKKTNPKQCWWLEFPVISVWSVWWSQLWVYPVSNLQQTGVLLCPLSWQLSTQTDQEETIDWGWKRGKRFHPKIFMQHQHSLIIVRSGKQQFWHH